MGVIETGAGDADRELQELAARLVASVDGLMREAELVYTSLVLPRWCSPNDHGFPQTPYGYMMSTFSFVDVLSKHCYINHSGTVRMRRFLCEYMNVSPLAATLAVKVWRHTLMHTAAPQNLADKQLAGGTYGWLLHWREHLPREQHMQLAPTGGGAVLSVGLLYLIEDLSRGARAAFRTAGKSAILRDRFLSVSKALSSPVI
jgi:hypothetical protein